MLLGGFKEYWRCLYVKYGYIASLGRVMWGWWIMIWGLLKVRILCMCSSKKVLVKAWIQIVKIKLKVCLISSIRVLVEF